MLTTFLDLISEAKIIEAVNDEQSLFLLYNEFPNPQAVSHIEQYMSLKACLKNMKLLKFKNIFLFLINIMPISSDPEITTSQYIINFHSRKSFHFFSFQHM